MTNLAKSKAVRKAEDAFSRHRELLLAETYNPGLRDDPRHTMKKLDAYEAFTLAFEAIK